MPTKALSTHERFVQTCTELATYIQDLDQQVAHLVQLKRCLSANKDYFVEADTAAVAQRVEALQAEANTQRRTLQARIDRYEKEVQAVQRCLEGRHAALQSCTAARTDEVMQRYFDEGQARMQQVVDAALLHLLPDTTEPSVPMHASTERDSSLVTRSPCTQHAVSPCSSDQASHCRSDADCTEEAEGTSADDPERT